MEKGSNAGDVCMKVRQLIIENFRGVKKLDWSPENDDIVCLVGHGDSSKSTILKAIEYVLYPRWSLHIKDTDFYLCDPVKNKIVIRMVVGELPPYLKYNFDNLICHWNKEKKELCSLQEGEDNDLSIESVLVVELKIDDTLEPKWVLKGESDLEEELSSTRRGLFNMARLDNSNEHSFQWKQNTLLTKLTESGSDGDIKSLLSEAGRGARRGFDKNKLPEHFKTVAENISNEAKILGAGHSGLSPNLDIFHPDAICLHDINDVPVYMLGEGSKKLLLLSMEKILLESGKDKKRQHLTIIDEIERGLEPHRLRHLILMLKRMMEEYSSQAFIATHSPTTIVEIGEFGVYRVKNNNGDIKVVKVADDNVRKMRKAPEGFFINNVILCEGKTELGVLRAFKEQWVKKYKEAPENKGVYFIFANGDELPHYAKSFSEELGYRVCVYCDSDKSTTLPDEIKDVFKYDGSINIEQALCNDAPTELLKDIRDFCKKSGFGEAPEEKEKLATFLHDCNDGKGAFRTIGNAEELGKMILKYSDRFPPNSTLLDTINKIETWIYDDKTKK